MAQSPFPWGNTLPPPGPAGGPTPSYPILTEELGYPPSPVSNGGPGGGGTSRSNGGGRGGSLGPVVNRALQEVLGWKIKSGDSAGFVGALNQSFQLKTVEGAVVSTWTPRSYVVQTDLSGGITGAQASIYAMAKTTLDQMLPLIDGLYPLDPASNAEDVAALRQLVTNQLSNLTDEFAYLGGPRVMRVQQYFQMLLGVTLNLTLPTPPAVTPPPSITLQRQRPPGGSPLRTLYPTAAAWAAAAPQYWNSPDFVLGSLGDLRDELGLFETIGPTYVNTISDEQNVTNFRIVVDYANSLLNAWTTSIQYFAGTSSPFLGTQLVLISRQLGVISEVVDEVRFVLDSVFVGPAQRETQMLVFQSIAGAPPAIRHLAPIAIEDLLVWIQKFVGPEAQDVIQNGGKLGLGEDFCTMILQLCSQAYGLYLFAQDPALAGPAIATGRVLHSLYKLAAQLGDLYTAAAAVSVTYIAPRQ
jgi:hypothetical protein